MHRIIIANRRGHQVIEWETTDTEEAREQIAAAERIIREARERGCAISKRVGEQHVLDNGPFPSRAAERPPRRGPGGSAPGPHDRALWGWSRSCGGC
jgi:hypothetical protein